jgi:hypothetical protein
MSSEEGLGMFRNWKTHNTLLRCVLATFSHMALAPYVRVVAVEDKPARAVLRVEGTGDEIPLDLRGLEIKGASLEDLPFDVPPTRFSRFWYVSVTDEKSRCVLAEFAE